MARFLPMRLNVLLFAAGVCLLQQQAELPEAGTAWLLAGLGVAALLPAPPGVLARARRILVLAACCAAGYGWAALLAGVRLADQLPPEWEGRDIRIEGVIAGLPQPSERSLRFEFDVERVLDAGATVPARIVLSWWGSPAQDGRPATPPLQPHLEANAPMSAASAPARSSLRQSESGAPPSLSPGERWQLTVRLRRPRGTANPHGFDYEAWLLERKLRATGYVRPRSGSVRVTAMVHKPQYWVERTRAVLRARILAALPDRPYAGVLVALAVGDQRAIPPDQWQVYTRTGVNHLMSISGLHITMVSGLVFALAGGLWRRSPRLTTRIPALKAAALAGLATACGYALLAGFAVPAQRTVYMLCVVAAAVWLGMLESPSVVLAVALLAVLLLDPWAVVAPGFWLSFGAVGVIMYVCNGRIGRPHWLATWMRVQLAVTLAMVPVLVAVFQQVSVVSPVANALAIPAVGLAVVPLSLIGMVLPADWLLLLAHELMSWCTWFLEWLSNLDAAVWEQRAPPVWAVAAAGCGVALMLAPRGLPGRWLGAVGLVPLFATAPFTLEPGALQVTVLDVGQGAATVVRTARHTLLYDTGPGFGPQADSGNRVIVPFLRALGITRLDAMIVSHDHADHSGGAASVLQVVPVDWLFNSLPDLDPLLLQAEDTVRCVAGQRWEWDGVRFEILHPARADYDDAALRVHDRNCVLMISGSGARVLLPGDIETRSEAALAKAHGASLNANVLLAPHHGSKSSSTPEFLEAVKPRLAVFAVGYRNRFNHPHGDVLARYTALGSRILRTDRDGALNLLIGADGGIAVTPYRSVYRRYWHTQMEAGPAEREQF